ncbi:MAG: cellulase family glycosylhydrolase, partial [Rhodothermales bacterium]|nr:cellulase family glycosylhydrolase [Rhodothermales bacterium]
ISCDSGDPEGEEQQTFFRTSGKQILNREGQPVVLRGVGLGGWLMPEGYMLHTPGYGSPTSIRGQIEDLIGAANADRFFEIYRQQYVKKEDIDRIAEWGFDHIRLPFHYKVLYDPDLGSFREEGFDLFDRFIGWCKANGIYVILDMHAAPGGQNGGNISDSDGTARLWLEPENQELTIEIWNEIARRYKNEPWIIGYDLINEPVLPSGVTGTDFRRFMLRLSSSVRNIDPNHTLYIEGNWYATDFSALTPAFDNNMVWAFHKYWNSTDAGTIGYLFQLRDETNTPLWLGESGENSNDWFYEVTRMVEQNGIGWNWWTHKKIETVTSPLSAPYADGYEDVLAYWRGQGPRPSADAARQALFAMAENLSIDRCDYRPDVVAALFSNTFASLPTPYRELSIPGTISATDYDIGAQGVSYSDTQHKNESGSPGLANNGGQYRNDGVDIERTDDISGNGYNVGWIDAGEWLRYTVDVAASGSYTVTFRVASASGGGRLAMRIDGVAVIQQLEVSATGGWQSWNSVSVSGVALTAGRHELRIEVTAAGFNLNTVDFGLSGA